VRRCECLDLLASASIHSHVLPPRVPDLSSLAPSHRSPDPWPRVVSDERVFVRERDFAPLCRSSEALGVVLARSFCFF
jgi:hypothetical protein